MYLYRSQIKWDYKIKKELLIITKTANLTWCRMWSSGMQSGVIRMCTDVSEERRFTYGLHDATSQKRGNICNYRCENLRSWTMFLGCMHQTSL
jgi:hypothetical protein